MAGGRTSVGRRAAAGWDRVCGHVKKIGVLFGQERTFPYALIERINALGEDATAEPVQVGGVGLATPSGYDLILDRICQDVPFYRAYLKKRALNGTAVVNNPFWWSADDKFFNNCLATKLGVAVPKTVLLPSHDLRPDTTAIRSEPGVSARLGGDLRLRRLPGLLQAVRRRRLEERLPGARPGGVLRALRPDRPARDDAPGGDRVRRVLPLLRHRPARRAHHAATTRGSRSTSATCRTGRRSTRAPRAGARRRADALPRRWATTSTRSSSRCATASLRHRLLNPAPDADLNSVGQDNFDWVVEHGRQWRSVERSAAEGPSNLSWGELRPVALAARPVGSGARTGGGRRGERDARPVASRSGSRRSSSSSIRRRATCAPTSSSCSTAATDRSAEQFKPELHQSVIEVGHRHLPRHRRGAPRGRPTCAADLATWRRSNGLRIAAAGTHPFSHWQDQQITQTTALRARSSTTCSRSRGPT